MSDVVWEGVGDRISRKSRTDAFKRAGHSSVALGRFIYIAGGFRHEVDKYVDCCTLDIIDTLTWKVKTLEMPQTFVGIRNHTAHVVDQSIVFIGGFSGKCTNTMESGLNIFDTRLQAFSKQSVEVKARTQVLSRSFHSSAVNPLNPQQIFIAGGIAPDRVYLDDLILVDVQQRKAWDLGPLSAPPPRAHASLAAVGEHLILYGGKAQMVVVGGSLSDGTYPKTVYSLKISPHATPTPKWTLLNSTNHTASARSAHSLAICGTTAYVIGGYIKGQHYPTDAWRFTFDIGSKPNSTSDIGRSRATKAVGSRKGLSIATKSAIAKASSGAGKAQPSRAAIRKTSRNDSLDQAEAADQWRRKRSRPEEEPQDLDPYAFNSLSEGEGDSPLVAPLAKAPLSLATPEAHRGIQDMQRQLADFRERERESAAKHEEAIVSLRNELQDARDQVQRHKSERTCLETELKSTEHNLNAEIAALQSRLKEQMESNAQEIGAAKDTLQSVELIVQERTITSLRLAQEKEALIKDLAQAKAHRIELEHEIRLKSQARDQAEKDRDIAETASQESAKRCKAEVAHLTKQLQEIRQMLAEQKSKNADLEGKLSAERVERDTAEASVIALQQELTLASSKFSKNSEESRQLLAAETSKSANLQEALVASKLEADLLKKDTENLKLAKAEAQEARQAAIVRFRQEQQKYEETQNERDRYKKYTRELVRDKYNSGNDELKKHNSLFPADPV